MIELQYQPERVVLTLSREAAYKLLRSLDSAYLPDFLHEQFKEVREALQSVFRQETISNEP